MNKLWTLTLGTLTLGLTACGSNGIEGIWVITLDAENNYEVDSSCSENFREAACSSEDDGDEWEWTITEQYESSPGLIMAEIVGGPRGEAFLFIGDELIPGAKNEAGVWTFEFDSFEDETTTSTHGSGYSFTESYYDFSQVSIIFTADLGGHAEGVIKGTNESSASYLESDTWSTDDLGSWGDIPSDYYLDGDGNYNHGDETNCEANPCRLELTQVSTSGTIFTASRTELNEGDDFTAVEHDGNQ